MIYTPTYRLEPETVHAVLTQRTTIPHDWVVGRDNPYNTGDYHRDDLDNHLYAFQKGRRMCLDGGYDYLWTVESDMIPPPYALERLHATDADIALGTWCTRRTETPVLNVMRHIDSITGVGGSLTYFPEQLEVSCGKVIECAGAGLGCTLIKRRVLEAIEFRPHDSRYFHCDLSFSEDCIKHGFIVKADMALLCGHKRADRQIIWPTSNGGSYLVLGQESPYHMPIRPGCSTWF